MDCHQCREWLEAYALGALEAEEEERVTQHVAGCEECQRLLREYREVVATLPEALSAVTPESVPASVKSRLLRKLGDSPTADNSPVPDERPIPVAAQDAPSVPLRFTERRRGNRKWPWQLAAALLGVLFLAFLAWNVQLNVALARERALRAEVADLVGQQELVLEVVDSDKTQRSVLLPPGMESDAYGKLFTRSDMLHVVAMAARLQQPPAGQAYHLWLTRGTETQLAGVMAVDKDGFGLLIFEADQAGPVYDSSQLTLQPLGSTTPDNNPILVWRRN